MVDDAPTSTPPLPPPPITALQPPRGHRSDTVGIFIVLAFAGGAGGVSTSREGSLASLVPHWVMAAYTITLVLFGVVGVVSTMLPVRLTIPALGLELAARIALTIATATYATAVLTTVGATAGALLVAAVFYGIAMLCAVAGVEIARWLVRQRRAVTAVLAAQEAR